MLYRDDLIFDNTYQHFHHHSLTMEYAKKVNSELVALLKERNLPHSGKKADLVKRLEEDDAKQASQKPANNEDEIDFEDDEPATETAKAATTEAAATAIAAGGQGAVQNPQAVPNQEAAIDPAQTDDLTVAAAPTDASTADAEAEKKQAREEEESAKFRAGLAERTLDEEIEKRKARRARFGITDDDEELKKLERAKRFGTTDLVGLVDLNKALPMSEDRKQKKRGREAGANDSGVRKKSKGPAPAATTTKKQGGKAKGDKSANGGYPSWMTESDKAAAEARKAKFAAA